MAIYHHSTQVISRKSGQSVCASAAYRSAEKLENERDGMTHDYSRKDGVVHKEILAPENAPEWATDRERLWNEVEKSEKRVDAQLAREVNIALPTELNREEQIKLITEYTKEHYVDKGMIADVCVHDKEDGNPHAHIMLTMRDIDKDGFGKKNREWNEHSLATEYRKNWAEKVNHELEKRGYEQRIDHRSYKEQGIEKVPQIHEGAIVREMEKRGIETDRGNINREIAKENRRLELYEKQHDNLAEERKMEQAIKPEPVKEIEKTPEPETPKLDTQKVTVQDLLNEAREYNKILTQRDQERAQKLTQLERHRVEIANPYRAEAVEKYLNERWGQKWENLQKDKRRLTQQIRDYNDGKGYGFFDKHINGRYEKDGELLRHESRNIDYREKDLIGVIDRERKELVNPHNVHAHGRYEVDRMADRLAEERDPQYKAKVQTLQRVKDLVITERQGELEERKTVSSLCRNLEKVRDRQQEIELPLPREQGKRLSIAKGMEMPQIRDELKQVMGKANQTLEQHHKSLERSRGRSMGMER